MLLYIGLFLIVTWVIWGYFRFQWLRKKAVPVINAFDALEKSYDQIISQILGSPDFDADDLRFEAETLCVNVLGQLESGFESFVNQLDELASPIYHRKEARFFPNLWQLAKNYKKSNSQKLGDVEIYQLEEALKEAVYADVEFRLVS